MMRHSMGARRSAPRLLAGLVAGLAALAAASFGVIALAPAAGAAEEVEITISIKDHKFDPAEIKVPAATAIKLMVNNQDATPEEFESDALGVEKVIAGNASAAIRIKPLAKGSYAFFGEFHEDTAQGTLVAE